MIRLLLTSGICDCAATEVVPTSINVEENVRHSSSVRRIRRRPVIASLVEQETRASTNIRKETVLAIIQKHHSESVADLKHQLKEEGISVTERDLVEIVRDLQSEGAITLRSFPSSGSFLRYLFNYDVSWWTYLIIFASAVETVLVVENVQSGIGTVARLLLGLGLLGLLPGYCTVQILFPGDRLPFFEQALLSIFLSVVTSIASGVILGAGYYFTGVSSVLALTGYTIAAALFAGYRRYSLLKSNVVPCSC